MHHSRILPLALIALAMLGLTILRLAS